MLVFVLMHDLYIMKMLFFIEAEGPSKLQTIKNSHLKNLTFGFKTIFLILAKGYWRQW